MRQWMEFWTRRRCVYTHLSHSDRLVQVLVAAGASKTIQDNNQRIAAQVACNNPAASCSDETRQALVDLLSP